MNAPERLGLEGPVPARRFVIPGPHEGPTLDDDDPHARVAVLGPGTDAEDLGFGQLLEYRLGESSCGGHGLNRGKFAAEGPNAADGCCGSWVGPLSDPTDGPA